MATGLYAGTTLADDGSPILLFDPVGLAEVGGVKLEALERTARIAQGPAEAVSKATAVLLFRGLDGGRRALRLAVVDRIEEVPASAVKSAAGQLRVQVGEAILPLAGATAESLGDGKIRVFRLNDGRHEMGYAFAEVIDFAAIENEVIHAERPGEVSGVSLVNGEPAELVDAHWLFANHVGAAARVTEQMVCRLPSDDPWMQNMLRPIVEAAGYRVIGDEEEGEADLVIAAQGEKTDAANAIYLRTEPEPKNKKDDSIYRYDRAGLLMALKSAGGGESK
jgi:two-component system chemotaxis sensor kinase CheA